MTLRSLTSDENLCTAAAGLESAIEFRGQLLKQLFDVSKLVSFNSFLFAHSGAGGDGGDGGVVMAVVVLVVVIVVVVVLVVVAIVAVVVESSSS